ncbi:MAG: hypothetical protein WBQ13_07935, partial [Terriglobales bacterium]
PLHSRRPASLRSLPLNALEPAPDGGRTRLEPMPDDLGSGRVAFDLRSVTGREPDPLSRQA